MEWRIKEAIRKGIKVVKKFYPDYALIGRIARNFYAPPETTLDVDFLVDLDKVEVLAELIDYVRSQNYEIFPAEVGHWQYRIVIKGMRIDLVKPKGVIIDQEMISRRRNLRIKGIGEIYVISSEDLAVLYVISSLERGVKDLIKAKDVISYSIARRDFNVDYFLHRCDKHNVKPLCMELI
ncbi:hypothetical protein [Sulfolobus sp. E11-6]|uniref:hypothetical protein n=1 Tax=Sulfolobus sp. E11-6 TaxID=2663020 RepID=UPI0015E8DE39|nr:hypothetical protein [Sulfolobus sp. E11-6]